MSFKLDSIQLASGAGRNLPCDIHFALIFFFFFMSFLALCMGRLSAFPVSSVDLVTAYGLWVFHLCIGIGLNG